MGYIQLVSCTSVKSNEMMRLIDYLLQHHREGYKYTNLYSIAPPVRNVSDTMAVSQGMGLIRIHNIDEDDVVTATVWEYRMWTDYILKWNPSQFGGISQVRLPVDRIWQPDIELYNSVSDGSDQVFGNKVVVNSDGTVLYVPSMKRQVQCQRNVSTLTCNFKYGSWVYDAFLIDLNFYDDMADIDLKSYENNGKFEMISHRAEKHVMYYPCCEEPYTHLTFTAVFSTQIEAP